MAEKLSATNVAFGRHLQQVRVERGFTQESLGLAAGLHRTYVGSVERGEKNPSFRNVCRLADGLGLHPSELLDGMPFDAAELRRGPADTE